jgi:hypothetical protein
MKLKMLVLMKMIVNFNYRPSYQHLLLVESEIPSDTILLPVWIKSDSRSVILKAKIVRKNQQC